MSSLYRQGRTNQAGKDAVQLILRGILNRLDMTPVSLGSRKRSLRRIAVQKWNQPDKKNPTNI